jgi:hypothetical protein
MEHGQGHIQGHGYRHTDTDNDIGENMDNAM